MAKDKGILLNADNELDLTLTVSEGLIVTGMKLDNILLQNQKLIIGSSKGEIKEDPIKGVGAQLFVESEDKNAFAREIRTQLQKDGQTVTSITIGETIIINSGYES